ncbi:hypothetical protein BKI52_44445 [marine bacterium AO1-C]|nr:hypothetical protein BKI52_44445 [marine bacterium AO1-C]
MERQISFFVMTYKGWSTLKHVLQHYKPLVSLVVAARDQGLQDDYYEQTKALCASYQIPFFDRKNAPRPTSPYAIAISWRWMIDTTQSRLITLHDSLLPRYRGFNPLVSALINGDSAIGVTALWANENYDSGDIIDQTKLEIQYPMTIRQAIEKVAPLYQELVVKICQQIAQGKLPVAIPQDDTKATYSVWRDAQDYFINWQRDSKYIQRFVDAVGHPYAGAKTYINGQELVKIEEAEAIEDVAVFDRAAQIGKVIFLREHQPVVVCGEGLLKIKKMKNQQGQSYNLKQFRVRFTTNPSLDHLP